MSFLQKLYSAWSLLHTREFQKKLVDRPDIPFEVVQNSQFLVGRHNPIPYPEAGKFEETNE